MRFIFSDFLCRVYSFCSSFATFLLRRRKIVGFFVFVTFLWIYGTYYSKIYDAIFSPRCSGAWCQDGRVLRWWSALPQTERVRSLTLKSISNRQDKKGAVDSYYSGEDLVGDVKAAVPILILHASSSFNVKTSKMLDTLSRLLQSVEFRYDTAQIGGVRHVSLLADSASVFYRVIIIESYLSYLAMSAAKQQIILSYCQRRHCGIIGLFADNDLLPTIGETLHVHNGLHVTVLKQVKGVEVNSSSPILRVTKSNGVWLKSLPGERQVVLVRESSARGSVCGHSVLTLVNRPLTDYTASQQSTHSLMWHDCLQSNGNESVQLILFGGFGLQFWLQRLLLIDSIGFLSGPTSSSSSNGGLQVSLTRYVQVDIDDIFIPSTNVNFTTDDIQAMLDSQRKLRAFIPGFTFNLGFCGFFYGKGDQQSDLHAQSALVGNASSFWWFPHMWKHTQAHLLNATSMHHQMSINKEFAEHFSIPVLHQYSVSSHHSGIYPVYNTLYDTWKQVWNIRQTSTEQYPHLRTSGRRHGFIHRGIRVMPRQVCGLFTHTIYLDRYVGGRHELDKQIFGGKIFWSFIANPVLILMTHQPNYAGDRLALYVLHNVVAFISAWTNLRLRSVSPDKLADVYFRLFPEQRRPLWGNPCTDKRHVKIWRLSVTQSAVATQPPPSFSPASAAPSPLTVCSRVPAFVVLGPQKTGSTALYNFLAWHQRLAPSRRQPDTFEELQYFNTARYLDGVDWYLSQFLPDVNSSDTTSTTATITFEKSANYFDSAMVPRRMAALLPNVKLVVLLKDPGVRAYSWYQHQRAHSDPVALNYTFMEVLASGGDSSNYGGSDVTKQLQSLRNRCLRPGKYVLHIGRWLQYYPISRIKFVDADLFRSNPAKVMRELQLFLGVTPVIDYSQHLVFSKRKQFFCLVDRETGSEHCLGKGKGRKYPPMEPEAARYLKQYFSEYNDALHLQLLANNVPIPAWLRSFIDGA